MSLKGLIFIGLFFFAALGLLFAVVGLPFDYYHSFVIEERYGFNTKTLQTWFSDLAKSVLVSVILGALLLSAMLLLIMTGGTLVFQRRAIQTG